MFLEIFIRVLFLIFIAILGWLGGRVLKINSKDISTLLIYVIAPFVIFISVVQSPAGFSYFKYSLGALATGTVFATLAYTLGKFVWKDGRANLFGFAGGTGNTGYFGLPIVFALFNETQVAIAVFIILGMTFYEFTVGYFITAKGVMNTRQSIIRMLKIPVVYAAIAGLLFKQFDIEPSEVIISGLTNFKGTYSVLGMMVIGITLASFERLKVDKLFLGLSLFWKHIVYPVVGIAIFSFLVPVSPEAFPVIVLMIVTPMAANTVVISVNLGMHPEKAATAVMISTICAAISVPLAVAWASGAM
jgi:predicted permease